MSRNDETYGISGIPPPQDAKLKTVTIPYAPGMPFRLEISKLFPSDDPLIRKQWTLFILALEKFMALPVDQKLSYFQIAGIHGYPETPWDNADPPPQDPSNAGPGDDPFGGYCPHNIISFPTWHRPYVLLFEKRIWWHMKQIIDHWKLDASEAREWNRAADLWRLPYWDWARRQTYNMEFSLPYVLTLDIVTIYPPTGDTKHPNPLWGFQNPEKGSDGKPLPMGQMPPGKEKWNIRDDDSDPSQKLPWSQCSGVSRHGLTTKDGGKTYIGLKGINNFQVANASINDVSWYNPYPQGHPDSKKWTPPGTFADAINRMFSPLYNSTWGTFASTKWWAESQKSISTGYMSLEYVHNNVHNVCGGVSFEDGGVGHMSDVPVAAFDPLFWLHHCNVDRLLSIWQALNWQAWWDTPEPPHSGPTVPDPKPTDPLKPFHTIDGGNPREDYWTSEMARDWTKLNYQYDDLAPHPRAILPNGKLNEAQYKADLSAYIQATYPSTLEYFHQVYRDSQVPNEGFFGAHNAERETWNDYLINVVYDRYALGGRSYAIEFWLGGAPDDPNSTFTFRENRIGQVYAFGGLAPSSGSGSGGCANCGAQRDAKVLSRAQVPLTIPVMSQALSDSYAHIQSTRRDAVEDYLAKHLHWKYVQIGGGERPADEFPDTQVSVWCGTGKRQPVDSSDQPVYQPVYSSYQPVYAPTEGKRGGLTQHDATLGSGNSQHWNFRT
ncbi:common central domain of tyrosinase-domain-containing protein [Hypoxylon sp. NC1633]|nr:common central domain of tyrosinase-domain-containing protein [Hypoxylon sp. NC1633]